MQENPIAQRIVGTAYACGCGVPADLERARAFMKKAADHGDADAREWIRQHPAQ
jgi:TPR repeat protein